MEIKEGFEYGKYNLKEDIEKEYRHQVIKDIQTLFNKVEYVISDLVQEEIEGVIAIGECVVDFCTGWLKK